MKVAGKTDRGRVRELNEDAFGYREGLYVVADGMGGHQAGEVASAIAVETVLQSKFIGAIKTDLKNALEAANQAILKQAEQQKELSGMGTTIAVLYLENDRAFVTHVGDSRVYYFSGGQLKQLTSDHSLVNELVKTGEITAEQARSHPRRNILTRALGSKETVEAEVIEVAISAGDKFLLCSDGLTSAVSEALLKEIISRPDEPEKIVTELINSANEFGGADNTTVIVVEI